jgi:hypothetical protein
MAQVATIDSLRSLGFAAIGAAYVAVGSAATKPIRIICFTNGTDADMIFTDDLTKDKLFVGKGSFKLFDISTNRDTFDSMMVFGAGSRYYVKQVAAPSSGSVYVEMIYGS